MVSWQVHLADAIFRLAVKPRLARRKDAECVRAIVNRWALPAPRGAAFYTATVGRVPGEWVISAGTPISAATLIYLHGGGYFTGSAKAHRPITVFFARQGFKVFVPDYRLAPESPYPAAVDDAEAVWNALTACGHREVAVAGDSAGGGLALALMIRLRARNKALPFSAALFSPWTDLCLSGESLRAKLATRGSF